MTSRLHRSHSKLTIVAMIALACALGGCGRKGGLDLPPGAAQTKETGSGTAPTAANANPTSPPSGMADIYRPPGTSSIAVAPRGEKKRIPLDAILD